MFVERDANGTVKGVYAQPQPGYAEEELADDDPEILAYLNPPPPSSVNFEAMIRRRADALARAGDTVGALVLLHELEN